MRPLVGPHLRGRVAAGRAPLLLVVEGPLATADAEAVRLGVALAHGGRAVSTSTERGHHEERGALLHIGAKYVVFLEAVPPEHETFLGQLQGVAQVTDGVGRLHMQRNGRSRKRSHKDLHRFRPKVGYLSACPRMAGGIEWSGKKDLVRTRRSEELLVVDESATTFHSIHNQEPKSIKSRTIPFVFKRE